MIEYTFLILADGDIYQKNTMQNTRPAAPSPTNPFPNRLVRIFFALLILITFSCAISAHPLIAPDTTQPTIVPADKSLNLAYFKPRNIFQKLTWLNKDGKVVWQATLNLVTRIDSVNGRLVYLQIRNDGKKDSSVAEWPSLKPIYVASVSPTGKFINDYRGGPTVRQFSENNGKVDSDTTFTISGDYFDSFLTEYLLGALPLQPGYQARFQTGQGTKGVMVSIRQVYTDVMLLDDGQAKEVYLVLLEVSGFNVLCWMDRSTGDLLKYVCQVPDGSVFIKSKI